MTYDVIIIGAGITGAATAFHLGKLGIDRVLIIDQKHGGSEATTCSAQALRGPFLDNFSRLSHAFGLIEAARLLDFSQKAWGLTIDFCRNQGLMIPTRSLYRLIDTDHEWQEVQKAVGDLQASGFLSELLGPGQAKTLNSARVKVGSRVIGIQDDGQFSAAVEPARLVELLFKSNPGLLEMKSETVQGFSEKEDITVTTDQGAYLSKFLVVASHQHARRLLPVFDEVIIPIAEQYTELELEHSIGVDLSNLGILAHHGYYWGVFLSDKIVQWGGARFLRKFAGIGMETAEVDDRITKHLVEKFSEFFPQAGKIKSLRNLAGISIRPCDELPLIGPVHGYDRVLIGTGYMMNGLTLGYIAGKSLAELIANGSAPDLPRRLWPERLRHMPEG